MMRSQISHIFKTLGKATLAGMIGFGAVSAAMPDFARAESGSIHDDDRPNFGNARFIPGTWYHLNTDLPAAVVAEVERETGQVLCKYETTPGTWYSNLMPCPDNHPFMLDGAIGRLRAPLNTGNRAADFVRRNYAYSMQPTRAHERLARIIERKYQEVIARPPVHEVPHPSIPGRTIRFTLERVDAPVARP